MIHMGLDEPHHGNGKNGSQNSTAANQGTATKDIHAKRREMMKGGGQDNMGLVHYDPSHLDERWV
jgi:hypothetical protein